MAKPAIYALSRLVETKKMAMSQAIWVSAVVTISSLISAWNVVKFRVDSHCRRVPWKEILRAKLPGVPISVSERASKDGLSGLCGFDSRLVHMKGKNTMPNALIVWSEVPEQIAQFIVLPVDEATAQKLRRFNNQYINSCGTPEEIADEMNEFFYDKEFRFKYKEHIVEGPLGDDEAFVIIVQCGFIL